MSSSQFEQRHTDLTSGSLIGHILRMTPPMAGATFAMMAFNLADTWFVAKLGTRSLAAMGFTFPVVMVLHSLAMGLGLGASACVSRAIGRKDYQGARRLATYSLGLAFVSMSVLCAIGWFFMPPLFRLLGAEEETLALTLRYMGIWFLFAPIVSLPMVGNNAIRATGDTLRPSIIMLTGAVLNGIMDPAFIFGFGPIPRMGIAGAALATGLSRLLTLVCALYLMHTQNRLLTRAWSGFGAMLRVWKEVLYVAVPAAMTNLLAPLAIAVITRITAQFGEHAVAAIAAGQRIEFFTYVVPVAMGMVLTPIIGQNWGAGRTARARQAWATTNWTTAAYAVVFFIISLFAGGPVARLFSDDVRVVHLITRYIWILLASSVLTHAAMHTGFAFNAIHKPMHAAGLTFVRLMAFITPLAWLGARLAGPVGVYVGIAAGRMLAGLTAIVWFARTLDSYEASRNRPAKEAERTAAEETATTHETPPPSAQEPAGA